MSTVKTQIIKNFDTMGIKIKPKDIVANPTKDKIFTVFMTLGQLRDANLIDWSPLKYQRGYLANQKFKQGIATTILSDKSYAEIPPLHFRMFPDKKDQINSKYESKKVVVEVMDGLQRGQTSTSELFHTKFKMKGIIRGLKGEQINVDGMNLDKFSKKYPEIFKKRYEELQITIKIYFDITDEQAQELFSKILNNTNVINTQIIRAANSSVLADIIRAHVRLGDSSLHHNGLTKLIGSCEVKRLKMFTYTSKPDDTREYSYVNFDNGALVQEETVASMLGFFTRQQYSSGVLDKLYSHKDYKDEFPGFKEWKKTIEGYDKIITSSKRLGKEKLTKWQLINIFNLYVALTDNQCKITSATQFMKEILNVWYEETKRKSDDGSKGQFALDQNKTGKHGIIRTLKTLEDIIMKDKKRFSIVIQDKKRNHEQTDVEQALRNQDYKCPCGDSLHIDDMVGGHGIMYRYGGKTNLDNAVAIHNDCNKTDHFKDAA
jgi:hypothetical protein